MRVYISGPMSGYPDYNRTAFSSGYTTLLRLGHEPVSPAQPPGDCAAVLSWETYMRSALTDLVTCESVALLPGWEASRGARLEVHVAHGLGMTTLPIDQWEPTA